MKRKTTFNLRGARAQVLLALPLLAAAASPAMSAEYWLCAGSFTKSVAGTPVPMWGYADVTAVAGHACPANGGPEFTSPGPALQADASGLIVHLTNNLPEPTSLVIDGLPLPTDGSGALLPAVKYPTGDHFEGRVRSLTGEAAPAASATYTWLSVKPGSFLYRSGSHMQVQDQMGLYGAVARDFAPGQAYGASTAYDAAVTLLYSEIDPVIHTAVSANLYGPNVVSGVDQCTLPVSAPRSLPAGWVCSTVNYNPKFFLINGQPYNGTGTNEFATGSSGANTLVRFLNAGLETHVPTLQGLNMKLVAEDGNPYPYAKTQYTAFLPAMKTLDAIVAPATAGKIPVVDRMLNLTNNGSGPGGMLAYLTVASGANNAPQFDVTGCLPGPLNVSEGSSATCVVSAHSTVTPPPVTPPTMTYSLVSGGPTYVSLVGNTITAAPAIGDSSGIVTVQATDSSNNVSTTATFNVTVSPPPTNFAPVITSTPITTGSVGVAYSYTVAATDSDVPAQTLTYSAVTVPSGMTVSPAGEIAWTPGVSQYGPQAVTIRVTDDGTPPLSTDQSFTVNVTPANSAPTITSAPVTAGTVGVPYSYTVTATDADVPPQTLTFSAVTVPSGMTVASSGAISWTPTAGQTGPQAVTVRVTDNGTPPLSTDQSFSVTVVQPNRAPVAVNDTYTGLIKPGNNGGNTATTVFAAPGLLGNDTDADGDALTISRVALTAAGAAINPNGDGTWTIPLTQGGNSAGTVTLSPNGSFTLVASAFNGARTRTFTYQVSDGQGGTSNTVTVSLTINTNNARPVAVADSFSFAYDPAAAQTVTVPARGVLANDTDGNVGDVLVVSTTGVRTFTGVTALGGSSWPNAQRTATLNADGSFSVTIPQGFVGTATFTYQANDGHGVASGNGQSTSSNGTVTLNVTEPAPVVGNDVFVVARNSAGTALNILANDSDTTSALNTGSVLITSLPGSWTRTLINGNTQARYAKATPFTAATCTNLYPGASVDGSGRCVMPANQYVLPALGLATVNTATGVVTYKPALNFFGTESFGYTVADSPYGVRSSATVSVNVP